MVAGAMTFIGALVFMFLLALAHSIFKTPQKLQSPINIFGPIIAGIVFGILVIIAAHDFRTGMLIIASGIFAGLASMMLRDRNL